MARAVESGERARRRRAARTRGSAACIVRDGEIVGEGATEPTRRGRTPRSLRCAAPATAARGATAYVTLEPCAHHGRTPPCADALVDAGVAARRRRARGPRRRRCAAAASPRLRDAGVEVDRRRRRGAGAARSLAPYLHHRRTGRALLPREDRDEPRRPQRRGRRDVAVDHRRGRTRRRARAARRLAGGRRRLRDRARRRPGAHRPRRHRSRRALAPLRVLLDARGRVPADGPLFDSARPDAGASRPTRRRPRSSTRGAPPARRSRWSRRSGPETGVDSRGRARAARRPRCAPGDGRRRRPLARRARRARTSSTGWWPTSRRRCSARRGCPAFAWRGPGDARCRAALRSSMAVRRHRRRRARSTIERPGAA